MKRFHLISSARNGRALRAVAISIAVLAVVVALPASSGLAATSLRRPLSVGTHITLNFKPILLYTVPSGWRNFCDKPGEECFTPRGGNPRRVGRGKSDYVDVFTSVANSAGGGCPKHRPGPLHSPAHIVHWLRKLSSLSVSRPSSVTLGGLKGYVVNVRLRQGWTKGCPNVRRRPFVETLTGRSPTHVSQGVGARPQVQRLYLLGYNGGTLAVEVFSRKGGRALARDSKAVKSFYFLTSFSETGIASTPSGRGYWLVFGDGLVCPYGDAPGHGSLNVLPPSPIVGMASRPNGMGYWLVTASGRVYSFNAVFHGGLGRVKGRKSPIVGMAATWGGYWLVDAAGHVYPFGDAKPHGSLTGVKLRSPIVGMAATPDGKGYWLVTSRGGVYSFDTVSYGSLTPAPKVPIVDMTSTPDGGGYWLVDANGKRYPFGDATG